MSRWLLLGLAGCTWIGQSAYDERVDVDGDGSAWPADCDDRDAAIFPGAPELCDGVDNDCDDLIDEADGGSATGLFADADGDGFGDPAAALADCGTAGGVANSDDCDDTDAAIHPDAAEICADGIDQDCSGADLDTTVSVDFETDLSGVMSLNGTAQTYLNYPSRVLRLTGGLYVETGTAFLLDPVDGDAFEATFQMTIDDAQDLNGEGMAFAVLQGTDPTAMGEGGDGLGVRGLTGWGVEFDHSESAGDPDGNHVAIVDLLTLTPIASADPGFALYNSGSHDVRIVRLDGVVDVFMDGTLVVSASVDPTGEALIGFGATTDDLTSADHEVDDLEITCP